MPCSHSCRHIVRDTACLLYVEGFGEAKYFIDEADASFRATLLAAAETLIAPQPAAPLGAGSNPWSNALMSSPVSPPEPNSFASLAAALATARFALSDVEKAAEKRLVVVLRFTAVFKED